MANPDDWIVGDSEDEGGPMGVAPKPHEAQNVSSISEFTAREILLPTNKPSSVSEFTLENIPRITSATTAAADVVTSSSSIPESAPVQAKPKRPRPRPAYKGAVSSKIGVEQNKIAPSISTDAIDSYGSRPSHQSLSDPAFFTQDISERAKMRRRQQAAVSDPITGVNRQSSSRGYGESGVAARDMVINLSSDDERGKAGPNLSGRTTEPNMTDVPDSSRPFRVPIRPHLGDTSILPPSDPPSSIVPTTRPPSPIFDRNGIVGGSTPPTSPHVARRKKRRLIDDDGIPHNSMDMEDVIVADSSKSFGKKGKHSPKKQKKEKTRERKARIPEDLADAPSPPRSKASSIAASRRRQKDKGKLPGDDFKSKEFVDDSSEDDLALVPRSSKTAPSASYSDPASAAISALPSDNTSVRPSSRFHPSGPVQDSGSVIASLSTFVRPSAPISVPPSADPGHLISSPRVVIPLMIRPDKRKKHSAMEMDSAASAVAAAMNEAHTDALGPVGNSGDAAVPRDTAAAPMRKTGGKSRTDRKGKQRVDDIPEDPGSVTNAQDMTRTSRSIVRDTLDTGKPQPKARKSRKKVAILSSDEDEPDIVPEPALPRKPIEEHGPSKEDRAPDEDKENKSPPLSDARQSQTPSTTLPPAPAPTPIARPRNAGPRSSNSHVPPRRDSMSDLIRRVSSKVNSPLASPAPGYSPLAKASRAALSRIAPLHPNRRTPPPAPPRPPPPKKSKKMLDLEEKWEMELADNVEGWACMADEERAALRRAKRDVELGYDD
ncbi:hypothetical protein M0805_009641 [Coniferiporia weirii]|nr:hypothetical protein M0805_009641 [Coniferiporia weirii]